MPTNEERREVAARLLRCASLSIPSPIPGYLKKAVHGNYPHWILYSDSSTLERLASLIEPEPEQTCQLVNKYEGIASAHLRMLGNCSKCGEVIEVTHKFCFECGTRVVQ